MLTRQEDVWPWGRMPVLLCKCCGQPGANSFIDISCLSARAGPAQIAPAPPAGSTEAP